MLAGEKAYNQTGEWLPDDTLDAIRQYRVAIKGPLTTPVGGGIRSLNVTLRQVLDLYACVRPVRYFKGVPSPVSEPEKVDMVIFRENTEDVYAGIEWPAGSDEREEGHRVPRPGSARRSARTAASASSRSRASASKRLVRKALRYATACGRKSVTLVHKGNIMKFTEGAFQDWGYEVARDEFGDRTVTEADVWEQHGGKAPDGPDRGQGPHRRLHVPAGPAAAGRVRRPRHDEPERRLLSDALAAQVGGLGMAPGSNEGDGYAVFEATHGTAPKYANQDKVNPGSLILSGCMMLRWLGWPEAARRHRGGPRPDHRAEAGHLRPGAADGRGHPAQDLRVRRGDRGEPLKNGEWRFPMRYKVTVVGGAGNVGATTAQRIAEAELADVVMVDVAGRAGDRQGAGHDGGRAGPRLQRPDHRRRRLCARPRARTSASSPPAWPGSRA